MKILYLSFYYPPDLCAGSFRNGALVEALAKRLPEGSEIDVLTTLPNRYSSYSKGAPEYEVDGAVTVRRVQLSAHQSGMLDQSRSFLVFARFVKKLVRGQKYDLVFASSSRLMTAALGAYVARAVNAPLYLDIRDIFVDTIKDVLPRKLTWFLEPIFSMLESWTCRSASRLNVVSEGFIPYFEARYPEVPKAIYTNGIDEEFLLHQPVNSNDALLLDANEKSGSVIEILYAGNIGEGQGLHNILPKLAIQLQGRAKFSVIGAGGRLALLETALEEEGCDNVSIFPPIDRSALIQAYLKADVLFLHLNSYDAFLKVLPSKLFEYGALGKPVLAGVSGYAGEFVTNHLDNAEIFSPCKADAAEAAFNKLVVQTIPRPEFVNKFSRSVIMDEMSEDILATVKGKV